MRDRTYLILFALTAIAGIGCSFIFPLIVDGVFEGMMVVTPDSFSYSIWKDLPLPMRMNVYYFNVTNHEDILARTPGVLPDLHQIGPYVFEERHGKADELFSEDGRKVFFKNNKTWHFLPDESTGSLDDVLVQPNAIALSAAASGYGDPEDFIFYAISELLDNGQSKLFLTTSVGEITFDGVVDEIMAIMEDPPPALQNFELPIPFDKFGWFYSRNGSAEYEGNYTMYTGKGDFLRLGEIDTWQGSSRSAAFPDECNELTGSAGDFFPPPERLEARGQDYVEYFSPDVCRSIRFVRVGEAEQHGISGYHYALTEQFFGNATVTPDNACFNADPDPIHYLPNGLVNVSSCKFGAPAFVSAPHFYMADEDLLTHFTGNAMHPDSSKHSADLILEPFTGIPLKINMRLQINVLLAPMVRDIMDALGNAHPTEIELFKDLEPTFYPLMWFETSAEVGESDASAVKALVMVNKGVPIFGYVLIALAVVSTLAWGFVWHRKRKANNQQIGPLKN